jgi:3-phosphoshikimate 1-carboxyvinyltransferase
MNVTIQPGPLSGRVNAIPSKSQAHRMLICAAMADMPTLIICPQVSEDILATARCLHALCADVERTSQGFIIRPCAPKADPLLDCGESGSTYRFLLPVAAALGSCAGFKLAGRLPQRPMASLFESLEVHGISIRGKGGDYIIVNGRLSGGLFTLPGDVSSQFISGLLLAAPLTGEACVISLSSPLASKGYVSVTREVMQRFKVQADGLSVRAGQAYHSPGTTEVEGDWSNAAFWLCAAACGSRLQVGALSQQSVQGDKAILDILTQFGAMVSLEKGDVRVSSGRLHGAVIDISDTPDLAPAAALLGVMADGSTMLHPISRLRLKESDRAQSIAGTLSALGADIRIAGDHLIVRGTDGLQGGTVDSCRDHRIAMMAAIGATVSRQAVTIQSAEAVNKSYPRFFEDLANLGASYSTED